MTRPFRADLHIHTCLSPCAEIDMTPRAIVGAALERGVDIIAISDHNSAENAGAAQRAARDTALTVLAGMEVATSEEVHVLALFEDIGNALKMQETVYNNLPPIENDEALFGEQLVVNELDEVLEFSKRPFISAISLNLEDTIEGIKSLGGIVFASHIDRGSFSVISQLGFIPPGTAFDALEFSQRMTRARAEEEFGQLAGEGEGGGGGYPWVSFSDAHRVRDIGTRLTVFDLKEPTLREMKLALGGTDGRGARWT